MFQKRYNSDKQEKYTYNMEKFRKPLDTHKIS